MIFDALVSYGITGKLRGRRKTDSYAMNELVPVSIDEVSSADAPVAYWWHATPLHGLYNRHEAIRGQVAVRFHDGRLYQPLLTRDGDVRGSMPVDTVFRGSKAAFAEAKVVDATRLSELARTGALTVGSGTAGFNPARATDADMGQVARIESSSRDANIAAYSRHYGEMLLIDGVVHARTDVPVIDMHIGRGSWRDFRIIDRSYVMRSPQHVYALTRFEEAKAVFMAEATSYSNVDWKLVRPEIVDPSLVEFDETAFLVDLAARRLMSSLTSGNQSYSKRPYLSNEPLDTIVAYGELRDAVKGDAGTTAIYEKLLAMEVAVRGQGLYHEAAEDVVGLKNRFETDGLVLNRTLEFRP